MRLSLAKVRAHVSAYLRRQLGREALSSLLHVAALLALVSLLRPMFFRLVGDAHYQAPSVFVSLLKSDLTVVATAARRHQPAVPEALAFLVPTAFFLFTRRRLRWTDWEQGKALRVFVLIVVFMLAWSGSTFPVNMYLDRAHTVDRLSLVAFAALSWRYPVFVPLAVRGAIVMIKESYVPIAQDDFDFRAPAEFAVVFSVFVWASMARSFKAVHFLVAGIGSFATYYYSAGLAKWNFGPPHSWVLENHVSNISVASYVRGWASFVPEPTFLQFAELARKLDRPLQVFTLVVELGALVACFLHHRLTRYWFLGCFALNFGIFAMTGICFWKWMTLSLTAFVWMGRSGRPLIAMLHEHKLPLLLGVASIYYGNERVWYFPQTHVVWYDTRLTENYELYAVAESGQRYLVAPTYLEPMDMHFTQGRLCYATDQERSATGIYGTTGNFGTMKQLENFDDPGRGLAMQARGAGCVDRKRQARFDDVIKRFFSNVNRKGKRHGWLKLLGRPTHLWVFPRGELRADDGSPLPLFDHQEHVSRIEVWLTTSYHHGDALHRSEPRLARTVEIPR